METTLLNQGSRKSKYRCWLWQDNDGFSIISLCFLVLSICVSIALVVKIYFGEPEIIPQGAVATDSQYCSQVGVDILKQGGNAVDAAIASTICLGVVHPHITGLGGGGVIIVHNHRTSKIPVVLNFREQSPMQPKPFSGRFFGPETIAVPGLLRGLQESHKMFGSLEWSSLIQPSIKMAYEGFPVSQQLAEALLNLGDNSPLKATNNIFFNQKVPRAEGEIMTNPLLGAALTRIAAKGAEDFYTGETALNLLSQMKAEGLSWDSSDLKEYSVQAESAVQGVFGNKTIYTSGAPSLGPQLISFLNIFEGFNFTQQDLRSPAFYHFLIETIRITHAQAAHLGDPKFNSSMSDIVMDMINKTSANNVRKQLRVDALLPEDTSIPVLPQSSGSVISVMDNNDNYVSVVSGLNSIFGSQILSKEGYLLNNALANFYSADSSLKMNQMEPKKRPLQPYVPVIATESGRRCGLRLATGASEPSPVAQVIFNILQFDWTVLDAVQTARLHAAIQNTQVGIEAAQKSRIADEILTSLAAMGHGIKEMPPPYPSVNIIQKRSDIMASQSDSRGGGYAVKYGP